MDETNAVAAGIVQVISSPVYLTDFLDGLMQGAIITGVCWGFTILRAIADDKEGDV